MCRLELSEYFPSCLPAEFAPSCIGYPGRDCLAPRRGVFIKYAMRNAFDFALASVAVILDHQGDGHRISRCAIVLGAVAATPYRAREAEQVVAGNHLSDEVIDKAAQAAVLGAKPLALNEYKVGLVQKLVTEALQELRG